MTDFSNYEYEKKLEEMTELLRDAEGWGNGFDSTMGQSLIQMMVDVTDTLHYMLERRNTEAFLDTARLRSSIITRASELGYRHRRAEANHGVLRVNVVDGDGNLINPSHNISIPRFTEFTHDGVTYYASASVVITPSETGVNIPVHQGEYKKQFYEVNDQFFFVVNDYELIDNNSILISSSGEVYSDVIDHPDTNKQALSFLTPDEKYYDLKYAMEGMRVVFGDGRNGFTPTAPVELEGIVVDLKNQPINVVGLEFDFTEPPFDSEGGEYDFLVENITAIDGSRAAESELEIKRNAVDYHKTNNRAVNNDDYAFWVKRSGIGNIIDARAFGEEELDSLVFNMNNVYITYLKLDGSDLTLDEERELREYMDRYKTSQAHLVFINSKSVLTKLILDVRKNMSNPSSNSEIYDIVLRYLKSKFSGDTSNIGGSVYGSDIIKDLYTLTSRRNGVSYPLVEFAKIDVSAVVPFSYPQFTNRAFASLTSDDFSDNTQWILIVGNIICDVPIFETDSYLSVYNKMRDRIMEMTPYRARVTARGVAVDEQGQPLPITIDNGVGQTTLIGQETPLRSPLELVSAGFVGSSIVRVVQSITETQATHFYYSSPTGRRPMIPMLVGTDIVFTAPTDTDVNVYVRSVIQDQSTEVLLETVQAGESFTYNNTMMHGLQFEYVNDSIEDVTAVITYPDFTASSIFGIEISTTDGLGEFTIKTTSGDYSNRTVAEFAYILPSFKPVREPTAAGGFDGAIERGSFKITYLDGSLIYQDDSNGGFLTNLGVVVPSGTINYQEGVIEVPTTLPVGDYLFEYKQNSFNVISVGDDSAIQLIEPKPSFDSQALSHSVLRIL